MGYSASFEIAGKILNGREGFTKCLSRACFLARLCHCSQPNRQACGRSPLSVRAKVWKTIPGQVQDRDQISDPVAKDIPLEFNGGTPFVARLSKLDTAYIYQIFDSHIYVDVDERPIEQPDEPYDVVTFAGGFLGWLRTKTWASRPFGRELPNPGCWMAACSAGTPSQGQPQARAVETARHPISEIPPS